MAGFDTSNVAATVGQGAQPVNPLAQLEQFAGLQNSLNQNKMFQAKQLAGQAMQQSLGPDGQLDMGKFSAAVAGDPRTAAYAPEIIQDAAGLRQTGLANETSAAALAQGQFQNVQRDIATYGNSSKNPDPVAREQENEQAVSQALVAGAQAGRYPQTMVQQMLGGNGPGGATLADSIRAATVSGAGGEGAQTAMNGSPTAINTGGATKIEAVNPYLGSANQLGSDIPNTLSPSDANTPAYQKYNPTTHQMETVTKAQAAATPPTGPIAAAPPLGVGEGLAASAINSTQQYNTDQAATAGGQTRLAQLKEVDSLLQTPQGNTGPGTQVVNGWRNFLLGNMPGLLKAFPGLTQAQVQSATQDELKKYMTQIAFSQSGAFGPNTNEKLAAASAGNANPDMSNLANRDVTRMNIALERANQARLAAFGQTGEGPDQYLNFASQWNRSVDPRAFMLDRLSPTERQKMLSTITTPAEKRALLAGKQAAESAGLYQDSDIPR